MEKINNRSVERTFSDNVIIETIVPQCYIQFPRTPKNAQSVIAGDSHLPIPLLGKHYHEIDFTEEYDHFKGQR